MKKYLTILYTIFILLFLFIGTSYGALTPFSKEGQIYGSSDGSVLGNGFATHFGHNLDGSDDKQDNGVSACGKNTRYNKPVTYKKKVYEADPNNAKYASLPVSTLREMFGSANCSSFMGKKIMVCNKENDQCAEFELVEKGPGEKWKKKGHIVDLTGSGMKRIGGGDKTLVYLYKI